MKRPILEVSIEGVDGLLVAQDNGADRVELCASVLEGGITPSLGIVREALRRGRIPVFVIVRPRGGDFLYSEVEFASMREEVIALRECGLTEIMNRCLTATGDEKEKPIRHVFFFIVADPATAWLKDSGVALDTKNFVLKGSDIPADVRNGS